MEEHRPALQLRHLLQRPIPYNAASENPAQLVGRHTLRAHHRVGEHRKLWRRRHIELVQPLYGAPPSFQTSCGSRIRTLFCWLGRRVRLRRYAYVSARHRTLGTQPYHACRPKIEVGGYGNEEYTAANAAASRPRQAQCEARQVENRCLRACGLL